MAVGAIIVHVRKLRIKSEELRIHKGFDEAVALEQTVGAVLTSELVESLHLIRLNGWMVDAEGYGLVGVRAMGNGRWVVGEQSNCKPLMISLNGGKLFQDRTNEPFVEGIDTTKFQFQIAVVTSLIAGFDMEIDEIVSFQGIEGGLCFAFVIGVP